MRKLIEFQILDRNAEHYGLDFFELMTNAGIQVAKHIEEFTDLTTSIKFVCGHGNNAGDGFVAAEILRDNGYNVELYSVKEPKTDASKKALKQYKGNVRKISQLKQNLSSSLIIDCLLGSGIIGEPREPYNKIIKEINEFKNIISVDVPSGFGNMRSVKPLQTITFHEEKIGMNHSNCGDIFVVDVGFPSDIDELTGPGELFLFPLVHVFVPEVSYGAVSSFAPELIVHKFNGNRVNQDVLHLIEKEQFDSIVVGPGMGKHKDCIKTVQGIIDNFENLVLDADAIGIYKFRRNNLLMTPHAGELSRLNVKGDRKSLMSFSKSNNLSLLSKGEKDYITDGNYFKINTTGHPRMAVGGTGDLLSGFCGGLLAKGLTAFEAGRLATYVLGKAGELCYSDYGAGFLPTDLGVCMSKILGKK